MGLCRFKRLERKLIGKIVTIVADDLAESKGFRSKYVGEKATIWDVKPNPLRNDGVIPVFMVNGKLVCDRNLWWTEHNKNNLL